MSYQPYYIAAFEQNSGLNTYYEPFLIPEKAFPNLEDCFCFRGKVIRRQGFSLLGRLRRVFSQFSMTAIDSTTTSINLLTGELGLTGEPNAQIEPKTLVVTIAAPISQTLTDVNGNGILTIAPAGIITDASIDYNTGVLTLVFSGAAAASAALMDVAYFPGLPVMGLRTEELLPINEENTIAFDTKYAYQFDPVAEEFEELPAATPTIWNGANFNLFWTTNYYKDKSGPLFWATNTNLGATPDPLRYYNTNDWTTFEPLVNPGVYLEQAEVILPYKDRLLFMNTWEGADLANTTQYPQRIRFSWNGDPLHVDAFRDDMPGHGGYIDAPTSEVIVSAEFIKDTLLIKFERSSWKLVYTGNETLPFVFQKINTELGAESKFSLIPFDRGVFCVGNYGITSDDSVNVERIDTAIPNLVFDFSNDAEGVLRVYGIRDFTNELVYWAYPDDTEDVVYPNKVLLYNYRNSTFAILNDSFTCYGYFQKQLNVPWSKLPFPTWAEWQSIWSSGLLQEKYPLIVAGNQHGFVEYFDDTVTNDPSLFIKSINFAPGDPTFVVPDHNLNTTDVIEITDITGGGTVDPSALNGHTFQVSRVDKDTITIRGFSVGAFTNIKTLGWVDTGSLYTGAGQIQKINGLTISTKVFSPFYEQGGQCRLGYIDFLLDKTTSGEITSNVYVDEDSSNSVTDAVANPCLVGSSTLYTKPENATLLPQQLAQKKIWHRQFVQTIAQNFQIVLSMTPEQKADPDIADANVILHALAFYISPNARLTQ
ncbi:MAG: hypothetical protein LLG04_18805 [Parachlamydia sp.]|nr:hypothetical protein [Parachlamydia sp.]